MEVNEQLKQSIGENPKNKEQAAITQQRTHTRLFPREGKTVWNTTSRSRVDQTSRWG
jgi:hypothetical protein